MTEKELQKCTKCSLEYAWPFGALSREECPRCQAYDQIRGLKEREEQLMKLVMAHTNLCPFSHDPQAKRVNAACAEFKRTGRCDCTAFEELFGEEIAELGGAL